MQKIAISHKKSDYIMQPLHNSPSHNKQISIMRKIVKNNIKSPYFAIRIGTGMLKRRIIK